MTGRTKTTRSPRKRPWRGIRSCGMPRALCRVAMPHGDDVDHDPLPFRNSQTSAPMPTIIPSASSSHPVVPPPPAAFQPQLKILKRPTNASPSPSPSPHVNTQSLQEREARYQAARERIFGSGSSSAEASSSSLSAKKEEGAKHIRQPKGPEGSDQREKGFKGRGDRGAAPSARPPSNP